MAEEKNNPYYTIWKSPKLTFEKFFLRWNKKTIYAPPFIIYGLLFATTNSSSIANLFDRNLEFQYQLLIFFLTSLLGFLVTYLFLGNILPWIFKKFGAIWDGTASKLELANVTSLASIPYVIVVFLNLILLILNYASPLVEFTFYLQYVVWFYNFGLLILGVSIVQEFDLKTATLNVVLSFLPFWIFFGLLKLIPY